MYINTAKPFEKNIFCGGHELGYIYEIEKDVQKAYPDIEMDDDLIDRIMNRFAAELLMPQKEFEIEFLHASEMFIASYDDIHEDEVMRMMAYLMDYFYVPYKLVVYRLGEIGFLTEAGTDYFEKIGEEQKTTVDAFCICY